jgi:hypothetical protein
MPRAGVEAHPTGGSVDQHSGGLGSKFSGSVFAEIGCPGTVEALLAVDGRVDFSSRKNEPIFGRLIL